MTFKIPKFKHRSQGPKKLTGHNGLATKKKYNPHKEEEISKPLKITLREFVDSRQKKRGTEGG